MTISLFEFDAGKDREIWYPNLHNCLSFTIVLDDGMLLGTHMTLLTSLTALEYTAKYFEELRGKAKILNMLLIGNIGAWRTQMEPALRTSGNLRKTLRAMMGTGCAIYQYDSASSNKGGAGAAVHLFSGSGTSPFPNIELVKEGGWSKFATFEPSHKVVSKLAIKHVHAPKPELAKRGAKSGMHAPRFIHMVRATGKSIWIAERDMIKI